MTTEGPSARRVAVLGAQIVNDSEPSISLAPTAAAEAAEVYTGREYSVTLPEKLTNDGPWTVHRGAESPYKLVSLYPAPHEHVRTLYDNWENSVARFPHMPFLGTRKRDDKGKLLNSYTWMSHAQAGDAVTAIGSGMLQLGINPKDFVGVYSINCKEWVLADAAAHAYSMVSVPLYDTLGPDVVEFIANHAELACVSCSFAVLPTMLACLPKCPTIRVVIVFGATAGKALEAPAGSNCKVVSMDQVEALGRRHPKAHVPPKPSDMAVLCYTSGTTGVPKGAVLTHGALIANSAGGVPMFENYNAGDKHISYLPLAHIYERVNIITCIFMGAAVGFFSGNILELLDDINVLKPHMFPSVPRLWNRIYDRVNGAIRAGNPLSRALFDRAYAYKVAAFNRGDTTGGGRWGAFYDRVVFSKIKAKLGGEVKFMTSGASPISADVMMFLRVCFGAKVFEGYGMTETCCTISINRLDDQTVGHVGAPVLCCEVKLADIPEMNYTNKDQPYPRGEICVRGPTIFSGYYKDEVQTRECIDSEGWVHTGDVGLWLPGGRLKIIDRKKNIFKLSQGEYVAPEKIEAIYAKAALALQVFVYGDSLQSQLVGIVVPDPDVLLPWAKERNLGSDFAALCKNPAVAAAVLKGMHEEGRVAKLNGFEQVAAVSLTPIPWSVDNGILTPTFKLKRPAAKAMFQAELDALYASLPKS